MWRHWARAGVVHEQMGQQLGADVAALVEDMPVDEALARRQADVVLVEEQVAQAVVDQRATVRTRTPGAGAPGCR